MIFGFKKTTIHPTPKLIWVSVCDAVIINLFFVAYCALNLMKKENMWNWFIFMSNTPVTDWTDCSHWCLNVIFHYIPCDEGRDVFFFTHGKKKVCGCLLSFFISLCKHCCVRGISLFLDARVNFSFMPRFRETHTQSDTLTVRSQTVRTEQRRHLWWNKLKSLWCCASLWGWFQLLCALQGRPPTASPTKLEMAPVHLPYS